MAIDALVLLSGGIDSAAAASFMRASGYSVSALFIDYGQPAAAPERESARSICRAMDLPLEIVTASFSSPIEVGELPGRNGFFLLTALMSRRIRTGVLTLGIHAGTQYYDCTIGFLSSADRLVAEYSEGRIRVVAPFLNWTKKDIFEYYTASGADIAKTYSCETGTTPPCGKCLSCRDRRALGC